MRTLTDHIVEGDSANHQITITVRDEPGQGGACHAYDITGFDTTHNIFNESTIDNFEAQNAFLLFQNGAIKEVGVNGVTHEVLLAIVIDRLRSFQAGPYACHDNAMALAGIEGALAFLQNRTRERIARNVEGTHVK